MKIKKKILPLLLSAALVLSLLPALTLPVLAASDTYHIDYGSITILQNTTNSSDLDVGYYDSQGASKMDTIAATDTIVITQTDSDTATHNTVTVGSGTANITLDGVNISLFVYGSPCAFSIASGASANLTLTGANNLRSGD